MLEYIRRDNFPQLDQNNNVIVITSLIPVVRYRQDAATVVNESLILSCIGQ